MNYYVKHRTAQERSGSGYLAPDYPWEYDGPFPDFAAAKAHWDEIHPNWQEGCIVTKCDHCGEYRKADS